MYNLNSASNNNFELVFPKIPFSDDILDSKKISLQLYGTVLPGCTFDLSSQSWQGFDTKKIDANLQFNPLPITFDIDENFDNWKLIFNWLMNINNNKDKLGLDISEYSVDGGMIIYNNYHSKVLELEYRNLFPYDLSDVGLSYREGESYLECTATFSYDYYEIK